MAPTAQSSMVLQVAANEESSGAWSSSVRRISPAAARSGVSTSTSREPRAAMRARWAACGAQTIRHLARTGERAAAAPLRTSSSMRAAIPLFSQWTPACFPRNRNSLPCCVGAGVGI